MPKRKSEGIFNFNEQVEEKRKPNKKRTKTAHKNNKNNKAEEHFIGTKELPPINKKRIEKIKKEKIKEKKTKEKEIAKLEKKQAKLRKKRKNNLKKAKLTEKQIKRNKKIKFFIKMLILLLVLLGLFVYLMLSPIFNIKNINVEGNSKISTEQIISISGIKKDVNMFKISNRDTKNAIKQNPYIEDVKITKIYPNQIKIEVQERVKEFQILTDTGIYIFIDQQGNILDYSTEKSNYITITGFEITDERVKEVTRLEENDLEKMENILHILDNAQDIEIKDKITKIDTKEEYILYLESQSIVINLGNVTTTTINDKMLYVQAILKNEDGKSGTIFVNGNLNEGFKPYFSAN